MRTVVVLGVGMALLLAGCGGDAGTPSASGPSSGSASATAGSPSASSDAFGPSGTASAPAGSSTGVPSGETPGAPATTPSKGPVPSPGSKGLTTSAWATAANAACTQYAKQAGPGGGGTEPAQVQSRIRDRAWSITGRLRGLPQGTSQTEAFITLLYTVGQESDWLIQQYLDPKADKKARATAEQARDAQLAQWYARAKTLGTSSCATLMKAA